MKRLIVSNRVFWAAVFLTGCGIVSSVSAQTKPKNLTVDTLTARKIMLVDDQGKTDGFWFSSSAKESLPSILQIGDSEKMAAVTIITEDRSAMVNVEGGGKGYSLTPYGVVQQEGGAKTEPKAQSLPRTFKGSTSRKTEPFYVPSKRWKITWSIKDNDSVFSIWLVDAKTDEKKDLIANTQKSVTETSFIYEKGEFYLDISAQSEYEIVVSEIK